MIVSIDTQIIAIKDCDRIYLCQQAEVWVEHYMYSISEAANKTKYRQTPQVHPQVLIVTTTRQTRPLRQEGWHIMNG